MMFKKIFVISILLVVGMYSQVLAATPIISEDFENGFNSVWTEVTSTVRIVNDTEKGKVASIYPAELGDTDDGKLIYKTNDGMQKGRIEFAAKVLDYRLKFELRDDGNSDRDTDRIFKLYVYNNIVEIAPDLTNVEAEKIEIPLDTSSWSNFVFEWGNKNFAIYAVINENKKLVKKFSISEASIPVEFAFYSNNPAEAFLDDINYYSEF